MLAEPTSSRSFDMKAIVDSKANCDGLPVTTCSLLPLRKLRLFRVVCAKANTAQ